MKVTFMDNRNAVHIRKNVRTLSMCVVESRSKFGSKIQQKWWRLHFYATTEDKDEMLAPDTYIPILIESEDD